MSDINIRGLVVDSLLEMEKSEIYLSAEENAVLDKYDYIDVRDKAFYKRLMDGTTEQRIRIDYILDLFSSTKVKKMKPYVRMVLRMSVYQILWMDAVPDSAAVNEAVKLVVKHGLSGLKGFVNGVLRNISRNKADIKYPDRNKNLIQYLSVVYSCPEWIVDKLIKENGETLAEKVLQASIEEHVLSVRLRVSDEDVNELEKSWEKVGITVEVSKIAPFGRLISGAGSVVNIPGFDEGKFVVQDTGSMMVSFLAGIKAGDVIMDVCAAPGGKTIHAADLTGQKGKVYSYDLSEDRCEKIIDNIVRLNIHNVEVRQHDATQFIQEMSEKANVVIVDAPCSGIGVMGHKSDIKYRLKPEDIKALSLLQRDIIDTAVKYVAPGGRFVYSTCTISREENDEQARYIQDKYGFCLIPYDNDKDTLQLYPGVDKSDGFFIAVFEKR